MTSAISGASCRLTDGMKKVAGMRFLSSSSTTRRNPCRDPYCPMDSAPAFASPKRRATVSLSTSNESSTATRAPFGHGAVSRFRPARTVFTTVLTLSIVHCQPGFALVCGTGWACASASDGTKMKKAGFMADEAKGRLETDPIHNAAQRGPSPGAKSTGSLGNGAKGAQPKRRRQQRRSQPRGRQQRRKKGSATGHNGGRQEGAGSLTARDAERRM